jgi:hypothetical protein
MTGSLLQCYPPPALNNATNGTAFRASLLPLLAALPSAAAPTGFASLRSDRAFVRGLCFGNATVPSECVGCLSSAALNITAGCGTTTRRAGIWSAGCFVGYADTGTSSPSEDAFHRLLVFPGSGDDADTAFYYDANLHYMLVAIAQAVAQRASAEISGPPMLATADATTKTSGNSSYYVQSKVRVVAQCARDVAAADCVRCLQDSAGAVDWDVDALRSLRKSPRAGEWELGAAHGVVATVVGFNCHVRVEVTILVQSPTEDCE